MNAASSIKPLLCLLAAGAIVPAQAEPLPIDAPFRATDVAFVRMPGDATVSGKAYLRLEDGSLKDCAGFNIELLPAAGYSNERILKTYGNNAQGQILISQKPPTFTPDVKEYHELLIKGSCDAKGDFRFEKVPAGDYYVIAFVIWEHAGAKQGGGVMKRIRVEDGSTQHVELRNP